MGKIMTEEGLQKDLGYLLNGIVIHQVLASICSPAQGLKVLEPGCGSGKLGLWYYFRGADVTMLDIDPDAIKYAKNLMYRALEKAKKDLIFTGIKYGPSSPPKLLFRLGNIHKLPFEDGVFDFVFNEGVPHHWGLNPHDWRRQRCINEMARVTKKGGKVCIVGSNGLCAETIKMAHETSHTFPGMPPKQRPWIPDELKERMERAGLMKVRVFPCYSAEWGDSTLLAGEGVKA